MEVHVENDENMMVYVLELELALQHARGLGRHLSCQDLTTYIHTYIYIYV